MGRIAAIAAVGLAVFQMLRTHVADRYLIESGSMQPTLHGDPSSGDIVLVDKCGLLRACAPGTLRRFDIVVVRNPEGANRDPLIKRIGSLGDEWVRIESGDLFVMPLGGTTYARVQKDPIEYRDLRQTFFEYPSLGAGSEPVANYLSPAPDANGFHLPPLAPSVVTALQVLDGVGGSPAPFLRTVAPINLTCRNELGQRFGHAECGVDDIGIEVDVDLDARCEGLAVVLTVRGANLALGYARDGSMTFPAPPQPIGNLRGPALAPRSRIACGYLDGRVFLTVDDTLAVLAPWPLPDASSLRNGIRVAAAGAGSAHLRRVRLFHDIHYRPEVAPFAAVRESVVEAGQVFLLGDNTSDSVDSRRRGALPAADILGRPVAVIGPWGRLRWLPR